MTGYESFAMLSNPYYFRWSQDRTGNLLMISLTTVLTERCTPIPTGQVREKVPEYDMNAPEFDKKAPKFEKKNFPNMLGL